ncbi:MAG: ABC transporter substrate-binding protein [Clostridiales bacterium]|jgi:NitT/TauT family transport system substrate-binding protein|nr:ABC transporter substrate-binding protein [Clostridiales bacterium]
MKKLFAALAAALLLITVAACTRNGDDPDKNADPDSGGAIRIGAMNGPTMMGLGKLNDDVTKDADSKYTVTKEITADAIIAGLANKTYDAAAVPANNAAILFNNPDIDIKVAVINTLNVLYIIENGETINGIADLAGKTIHAPGQGSTPEYTLKYLLDKNGVTTADIVFHTDATEIVTGLKGGTITYAMLPQPAATSAVTGSQTLKVRLNLSEEWKKIDGNANTDVVTGVLVVRKDFLTNNKTTFDKFLDDYKASVTFMTDADNLDAAAQFVVDLGIVPALPVAKAALPKCNLSFIEGADMKNMVSAFLTVLYDQNAAAVGGKLPTDAFYYAR